MRIGIVWRPKSGDFNEVKQLYEYKSLGYDCVDFQAFMNTENVFFGNSSEVKKILKTVSETAKDAGIVINQTHGPWCWPPRNATENEREERFEKMLRSLEGTAMLGCQYMVVHPIMPFELAPNQDVERFMEINCTFFDKLISYAKKIGVVICLENMPMPTLPMASPKQILEFVKIFNSPFFRVCLDTGHSSVLKVSPDDAVRTIGKDYLQVLHVHDNDGINDLHMLPGSGVIDWKAFVVALNQIGFNGVFSLETDVSKDGLPKDEIINKKLSLIKMVKDIVNYG